MSYTSKYLELRKKQKKNVVEEDIAPVLPARIKIQEALTPKEKEDGGSWFQTPLFDDGYDFGDVTRTILGTVTDIEENVHTAVFDATENLVDTVAYGVGAIGGMFSDDFQDDVGKFIAKDLLHSKEAGEALGKTSATGFLNWAINGDTEEASVLADKSDQLVQSGAHLVGQAALQMVGVPWWVTAGVNSFGSEIESAFQQEATYGEAGLSGAISAGAEILTEKISGGIKFGGKALDDVVTKKLSQGISNKVVKSLVKFGWDATGEGAEEVLSGAISAVGQKITYADDKELNELFSSEDAWDAFIGGAVLGGGNSAITSVKNSQAGRDPISALTNNEQKVLDSVVEERIAEAEKGGKKLTEKEKNKIYDEVQEELKKGYISTDTIESILGGDTYKTYKDTIDSEEAILKEYEELGNKTNPTLKEQARYAELQAKVKEIEGSSQRSDLKTKLSDEVYGQLTREIQKGKKTVTQTDNYLLESYNERTRRGQAFEADVSKYDKKQATAIQKAIDSGILNNTNRTHEFVDMIAKISADKGVLFDFTNNERLKESGFAIDGSTVNGFVTKDGVTLNIQSAKALNTVVGHEITHVLEGTELYNALSEAVTEYARTKGEYDSRYKAIESLYKNVDGADINAELTADLIGDYLFTDQDFVNNLSVKHRNVFQKIYDEIKYLYNLATAGSKEARELEKVKRAFDKAYKESGKATADTKYSISEDAKIKDVSTGYSYGETYFTMSYTQDGKVLGTLEYGEYDGEPNVKMIEVSPEYRRQGIGTKLLQELQKKYPDTEINFGMSTPDGTKLLNSITYDVTDEAVATEKQKLKNMQAELNELQSKLDVLYDTENLTEAQENELHRLGDRWQEVYDAIRPLEKSLIGKKTTKTFIKTDTDTKYSISDSDGKTLTKEQSEYFKDSKMRDDNGNLMVMYHGSQDAGFHVFDASMSDDDTSFFFVNRNDVAASYSGTTETYEAQTIRTAEDMNNFIESIGVEGYEVIEKDGKFTLLYENERVADSETAQGIYEEFCWYEGVGEGDANYKVYLNLTNPLVVDAEGRNWNNVSREFSQKVADRYKSLTEEEKAALSNLAEWGEYSIFKDEMLDARAAAEQGVSSGYGDVAFTKTLARAYAKLGGANANLYDTFSIAQENFSEESIKEFGVKQMNTRDYAQRAKEQGYDGVIFKNIVDNGGYSNGSEGASTVAIAFDSNQIKSVANEKPTGKDDIRYSLSEDSEGRKLSEEQSAYFNGSKVVDDNGNLKAVYHGSPADFNTFSLEFLGTNGTNEGYGFYFTDSKRIAEGYSKGREGQQNGETGKLFEVYLDIKKPLSDTEVTMSRSDFKKLLIELNNQVDEDGEPLEFLANYGDVEWEGLNKVLNYAMKIEYDGSDNDVNMVHSIINSCGDKELVFDLLRKVTGYDGIIVNEATWGGDQTIYIAFHPEQIKNVDNKNPTTNPDIRYSLSAEGDQPKRYGNYNVTGKDIALEAPAAEGISEVEQNIPETKQTISETETVEDFAPISEEEANALQSENLASLTDADVPPEMESPYYEADTPIDPFENKDIKKVGDRKVKAYMFENPEVKPYFQSEADIMLGELRDTIKGERMYTETPDGRPDAYGSDSYGYWTGVSRHTTADIAYLLDEVGLSYADIEKGLNAIIEDNGKENIAAAKKIEFILNDRLMNGYQTIDGYDIPANQDYINLLSEKQIIEYSEEARKSFFEHADDFAPVEEATENSEAAITPVDNIAPVAENEESEAGIVAPESEYSSGEDGKTKPSGRVAKVMVEEPEVPKNKKSGLNKARTHLVDQYAVIEDLALETGNHELDAKANYMRYSERRAQRFIGKGTDGIRAFNDLRKEVESSGKTEDFFNYMYHLHNVDRMSIEDNAKTTIANLHGKFAKLEEAQIWAIAKTEITDKTTEKTAQTIREAIEYLGALNAKNKAVFGDDITAEISRQIAAEYEAKNPEFKKWAQDVYDNLNYLRQMLVDNNVISQETADLWAKMYPHYVPIRRLGRSGLAVNVPLDTRKTGVNAPIKRATGGNSEIMNMFNTIGTRIEQTFRATAKNSFGIELKNTLNPVTTSTSQNTIDGEFDNDNVFDSVDKHEELLKKGENGANPTFTVFENGKRVEFEITEDLYEALRPTNDLFKGTNKALNTATKIQRGVLTQYNPFFTIPNFVKDAQEVLTNSQHARATYAEFPTAAKELYNAAKGIEGEYISEFLRNGGDDLSYFDGETKTFTKEDEGIKKTLGFVPRKISEANDFLEKIPRLAEYIASRKAGASIEKAMLDSARVTTNFAAGGDVTKWANRNGFTFLNASVQGLNQQVRNIREAKANGVKGIVTLAAKYALVGLTPVLLNSLIWDDDEEYEELSDYVKDNYYIVAKYGDGKFVRIPKGRTAAVIQNAFEQMKNGITGDDEVDLARFGQLVVNNLAPNNPLENNVIAPLSQAIRNKTWYGEDLVPTRLQDLPASEQYDETTDSLSKWLGEKTGLSPYKINYVLDQYSGGIGDVFLPYMTPEADGGGILAPLADKFTTDSVLKNQNVSDFYSTVDELTTNAKSSYATDEDILKYKYINSVSEELSELYAQKREIQSSDMDDDEKYEAVRDIQKQIDSLAKNGLNSYNSVNINGVYATVGDRHYRWYEPDESSEAEAGWQKISDKQLEQQEEVTSGLGIDPATYWSNKSEYDFAYEYPEKYAVAKVIGGYNRYKTYSSELYDIKADKDEDGKTISGSRKEKVVEYINGLEADYYEKIILFKSEYNADDTYNYEILEYLNSREDISYDEMVSILKELGFTIGSDGVTVTW